MRVGGDATYDVVIGEGLASVVPGMLEGAANVAVVADPAVDERAAHIEDALRDAGIGVERIAVPAGEDAKSLVTVARLWDELGRLRLTRSDERPPTSPVLLQLPGCGVSA
jgi:3-dehydroquinate synthase